MSIAPANLRPSELTNQRRASLTDAFSAPRFGARRASATAIGRPPTAPDPRARKSRTAPTLLSEAMLTLGVEGHWARHVTLDTKGPT